MMRSRSQAGFTMVELAFVVLIICFLAALLGIAVQDTLLSTRASASIEQAKTVLRACEVARRKVLTTTVVNGVATHTYPSMSTWSSTQVLQSKLTDDYKLPDKNDLGTSLLVRFDSARCYVAVDLPFLEDNYAGMETQTVNGKTRVIVTTSRKGATGADWVSDQKKFLHLEDTR